MSDLDDDFEKPRSSSIVWSLAALSAAVFMCSVLGAKLLAQMIDRGQFASLASGRSMKEIAAAAPTAQAPQVYSIVRSVGVDGMATATIPHSRPAPLSPCGETKIDSKPKK